MGFSRDSFNKCLVVVLSLFPLFAVAEVADRLETAAKPSSLAARSLLLDITRVDSLVVAVGERGHIIRSRDGGQSWQQADVPVSVTLTAVQFVSPELGWAVGHDGVVLHSQDGGLSWNKQLDGYQVNELAVAYYQGIVQQSPRPSFLGDDVDLDMRLEEAEFSREDGPNRSFLDLHFSDAYNGFVVGAYGLILETRDGGKNWSPIMLNLDNPDSLHLNAITEQQGKLLIAGEAGIAFLSEDTGQSWQRLNTNYDGPFFSALALGQQGRFLLSGLRGRLFISGGAGESWQVLEAPTRSTINATLLLNNGELAGVGNGGLIFHARNVLTPPNVIVHPSRQSYTALVELPSGKLLLVGQKGVTELSASMLQKGAL
jgi:photosystem II stability/assembly factor-like uncharacterized protein